MEFTAIDQMTKTEIQQEIDEIELAIKLAGRGCVKETALSRLEELKGQVNERE